MDDENLYRIALSIQFRNRIRTALRGLDQYNGSARELWLHLDEEGMSATMERAKRELDFVQKHHIQILWQGDDNYPYRLQQCPDRPLLLYTKGNVQPNEGHFVSIVGTRTASDCGKTMTEQLVKDLAHHLPNTTIVSGLAYGIDVAAHRAAIAAGLPTLIIPAHGLDRIYPSTHRDVAIRALENGGLVTEYPSQTQPERQNFVARNRIVAGLADAVVVVESKEKGGSLITANMAIDYNRDLFAFPGRPTDTLSRGCNQLIRDNCAHLIESATDLMAIMQWESQANTPVQTEITGLFETLTPTQQTLLDKLHEDADGLHVNLIVMETGLAYNEVSAQLMLMEMQGLVRALPGGIFRALK